jgi:amino acid adenylation domain-containing protein
MLNDQHYRRSVPDAFEEAVVKFSERLAVKHRNKTLTYRQLNDAANKIAWCLIERCGKGNEPVAMLYDHGPDAMIAALAVLKAGKILVALDPTFPFERLRDVVQDLQSQWILSGDANLSLADRIAQSPIQVINTDNLAADLPISNVSLALSPEAIAQIAYTSGSTGRPKGVVHNHRIMLYEATYGSSYFRVRPDDRNLHVFRPIAIAFMKENLKALLAGAAIVPFDIKSQGLNRLSDLLQSEEITVYRSLSSTFRAFVETLSGRENFRRIRLILLGGETLTRRDYEMFKKHFPLTCVFVNSYNTTEGGTVCHYTIDHETEFSGNTVPIGFAADGKEVKLVDEGGNEVECGAVGEIVVKSRYLSLGYWRRPELTAETFLAEATGDARTYHTGDLGRMLPDGCLVHLGRKDQRVKIRGYRVEIGEVEALLMEHPNIKEAAVVAWDNDTADKCLVAYLVPRSDPAPTTSEIVQFLRTKLPEYMIPGELMFLEYLPQTNGKIDRRSLPQPSRNRPELAQPYVAPSTEVARQLVLIWEDVLNVRPIGIHDDFFYLGGHSLAAARIVFQVIKTFLVEIPLAVLFNAPTVADMAAAMQVHLNSNINQAELERILAQLESLTDEEAQTLVGRSE